MSYTINKVKINLEYKSTNISIEVEPYRPIKYIRERAEKLFYPLNFKVRLLYNNKDLSPYESLSIGEYFRNRSNLAIKIQQMLILPKSKTETIKILEESLKENKNISIFPLCSCKKDEIGYFCRICNEYICKYCRIKPKHIHHNTIQLERENLEGSIKFYAISLQADLSLNLKSVKTSNNNFETKVLIDPQSRKEMIFRKLDDIERRQEDFMKKFLSNSNSINDFNNNHGHYHNKSGINVDDFEKQTATANVEIEKLIEGLYGILYEKKNKKMSFEQAEKYIQMIHEKEVKIANLSDLSKSYRVNYEAFKKIDDMYRAIDKIIDAYMMDMDGVLFKDKEEIEKENSGRINVNVDFKKPEVNKSQKESFVKINDNANLRTETENSVVQFESPKKIRKVEENKEEIDLMMRNSVHSSKKSNLVLGELKIKKERIQIEAIDKFEQSNDFDSRVKNDKDDNYDQDNLNEEEINEQDNVIIKEPNDDFDKENDEAEVLNNEDDLDEELVENNEDEINNIQENENENEDNQENDNIHRNLIDIEESQYNNQINLTNNEENPENDDPKIVKNQFEEDDLEEIVLD